ncbi:MAG: hypothetical protein AB6733_06190 [Clostridiaceae bacterium]
MGFKDKITQFYVNSYLKKYGDRLTQLQGRVLNIKIEEKSILGIYNTIKVSMVIKPEQSKTVVTCFYKKNRWFKKPEFISINQGNNLLVQGTKGKKGAKTKQGSDLREIIEIINIRNFSTKKDLIPMEQDPKVTRVKQNIRYK